MDQSNHMLYKKEFPLSNFYDPAWICENQMGPNAVWLAEWLCTVLDLKPGMRVLDLGCGKAMTSIFIAGEFSVTVWAADLWVNPDKNWRRIIEAGMDQRVYPIRAEAHSLPFANNFFDAIISIDSYHYFGTDELYLSYLNRFVKPEGKIGVVVPGLMQDFQEIPSHLLKQQSNGKVFWEEDCISFHTAEWWKDLWSRSNRVDISVADTLKDGCRHWADFEMALEKSGKNIFPSDAETLREDAGKYIGFVRIVGKPSNVSEINLYEPDLLSKFDRNE